MLASLGRAARKIARGAFGVVDQLLPAVFGLACDGHAERRDMRKSLSCTRDLLLAFPRFRHPSVLPVTPVLPSDSRCPCHTVAIQSSGMRSSPRQAARPCNMQESPATWITQSATSSENAEQLSSEIQPEQLLAGSSSIQKGHSASVAELELRPIERNELHGYAEPDCE